MHVTETQSSVLSNRLQASLCIIKQGQSKGHGLKLLYVSVYLIYKNKNVYAGGSIFV